jgi:hypothetical protein|tara:strand:- start:191 stop:544 length:354 start_codon:yes stop_codon:yes gene_type:complete
MANTLAPATVNHVMNGSAKQWVNMNASANKRDSFNTSTTTDVNSGNMDYSFTNNMSNDDYCCNSQNGNPGDTIDSRRIRVSPYHYLTSGYSTVSENYGNNSVEDVDVVQNQVMGDLA